VRNQLATRAVAAGTNGQSPRSVSCPSNVEAKAGKTFECHVKLADGSPVTFTIRVDSVSGNNGHMTVIGVRRG